MGTRLFVGNISFSTTEQALRSFFEGEGWGVVDVVIVTDRHTGRSKGFGFVELEDEEQTEQALSSLDGAELEGWRLSLREAYERPARPSSRDLLAGGAPRGKSPARDDRDGAGERSDDLGSSLRSDPGKRGRRRGERGSGGGDDGW